LHLSELSLSFYRLFTILIGGLFVGVLHKYLGDTPGPFMEQIDNFKTGKKFDYKKLPNAFINTMVALIFGGSIGPEAGLITLFAQAGTWLADKVGHTVDLSLYQTEEKKNNWLFISGIASLPTMFLIIGWLGTGLFSPMFPSIEIIFSWQELAWAVALGIIGCLLGYLYQWFGKISKSLFKNQNEKPIRSGLISGLIMGLVALAIPEVMFSGQIQLFELFSSGHSYSTLYLLLITILNLFVSQIVLKGGWKGGPYFPIMFSGATGGMVIASLCPSLSMLAGAVGGMTAITAKKMSPIGAILIVFMMGPKSLIGVILIAAYATKYADQLIQLISKKISKNDDASL
jgi:H+/Cl- antiporter ClcA